jgi:hypothetical protein
MARRNKVVFLLVMPAAAFLWFFGWSLSFVGSKKGLKRSRNKLVVPNELLMVVPTLEKKQAI